MRGSVATALTYFAACFVAVFAAADVHAGVVVKTSSPDGKIVVKVTTDGAGHLSYSVGYGRVAVVMPSPLGVTIDGEDLGAGVAIGHASVRSIDEKYPVMGVHAEATNKCKETLISLKTRGGKAWSLEVRAYNDGAAYRYVVPGAGKRTLNGESSAWVFPEKAKIWYQNDLGAYEGLYASPHRGRDRAGDRGCVSGDAPATRRRAIRHDYGSGSRKL